jgi:ABC-2 type transport system ATP-binding protein
MIRIEGLKKHYGKVRALKGIDLEVQKGELFAFLGPNGAGKTTTIRILTGLTRMGTGRAWLGGCDIQAEPIPAKRICGIMPQHINLDAELTVGENLDLHGRLFGMNTRQRDLQINELLEYVDLAERRHNLVKQLSGGMKRRVMIARALMHRPGLLFLDEPTAGLDPAIRRRIWGLIRSINQEGATIFLTTHYIEEAEFLARRVGFIDQGRMAALDSPQNLMAAQGEWALDSVEHDQLKTSCYASREQAEAEMARHKGGFTLRRVNLEDAFLALTGRKIT